MDLPRKKYSIIYADPPWAPQNKSIGGNENNWGTGAAAKQYSVMSVSDLCDLQVADIAAGDSLLFMWWLSSMPQEALSVVKAWGFKLKTMTGFSFIKKTSTNKDHFGMGFYTRQQQEHCLIARRGKSIVQAHNVRQNIREHYRGHSCKPDQAYDRILDLCGDLPRIELFARRRLDGWDAWGNEIK